LLMLPYMTSKPSLGLRRFCQAEWTNFIFDLAGK
jgi:hypothetical protein